MRGLRPIFFFLLLTAVSPVPLFGQQGVEPLQIQPRTAVLVTTNAPQAKSNDREPAMSQTRDPGEQTSSAFPILNPRSTNDSTNQDTSIHSANTSKIATPTITVASSLAVVLGLFAALVWGSRKLGNGSIHSKGIPKEVVQSLGSLPLDPRTRITMLRCGNRVLVLSQSAGNTQTLCEITDPAEVQGLTAACLGDAKHDFATALRSMEREKVNPGYVSTDAAIGNAESGFAGGDPGSVKPNNRRRLFVSA